MAATAAPNFDGISSCVFTLVFLKQLFQTKANKLNDFFILLYLSDLHHITGMIIANFHWEARMRKTNHEAMFRGKVEEPLEAEVATAA